MTDTAPSGFVQADTALLQSLAHPLRMRMLGLLRLDGPSTATKLAERCGESSGLTSYHLRHLADAGLIAEAGAADLTGVVRTGGRERWWKAAHRATYSPMPEPGDEAGEAVLTDYLRTVLAALSRNANNWLSAAHAWPREWQEASDIGDTALRLTPAEAERLGEELWEVLSRYRRHDSAATDVPDDAAVVSVQLQLFPHPDQDPPPSSPQRGDTGADLGE